MRRLAHRHDKNTMNIRNFLQKQHRSLCWYSIISKQICRMVVTLPSWLIHLNNKIRKRLIRVRIFIVHDFGKPALYEHFLQDAFKMILVSLSSSRWPTTPLGSGLLILNVFYYCDQDSSQLWEKWHKRFDIQLWCVEQNW